MQLLAIFALSFGFIFVLGENCCRQKNVGGKSYTLLSGAGDTSKYGCKDSCVYTDDKDGRFCFKSGSEQSECKDGSSTTNKYFYSMPSILFDIPPVGQAAVSRQLSLEDTVTSHKKGYSTASGACATASIGVVATVKINVTITATTESNIVTVRSKIEKYLKDSFKAEFNKQFSSGYSLDAGFEWLGISADGEYHSSTHQDAFLEGEKSVQEARQEFTEAIKQQNSKQVRIIGKAKLEGRLPTKAEYCLFFAVEKVEFSDGTELFTVNDNPRSAKTGTSDGNEVPNRSSSLKVINLN